MGGIEEDRGEGRIVLDDEHERVLAEIVAIVVDLEVGRKRVWHERAAVVIARGRSDHARARGLFGRERYVERERRAFAGLRMDLQLSAEKPSNFATDRKAKPCAAKFAARRSVSLLEGLEDQLLFLLGDSNAGIGHGDLNRPLGPAQHRVSRTPAAIRTGDGESDVAL